MMLLILQEVAVISILSTLVILLVVRYASRNKKVKKTINLEVLEERLYSFEPRPLIDTKYAELKDKKLQILQPDEDSEGCLNLAKVNYLNLLNSEYLKKQAAECIRDYGVGSCGPRGFYGTIDVHLRLESEIADFMDMEETVLYSYGFSTIASAIGAYCKKSDIIFCDEKISFASKQGFLAAKSTIVYFRHNDVEDLEKKLQEYEVKEAKKKKMYRKFLIVEGIYARTGTICPLPELMILREKYHLRIFIDESISFGVVGKHGKGVTEHFNVDRSNVDMIMGSLEGSVGSIGGFCVGASVIIEHQRLSGLGYCFSASLPPCLSDISSCALKMFKEDKEMFERLGNVCAMMNGKLKSLPAFRVLSSPLSPLQVITTQINPSKEEIDKIHRFCAKENLHLVKQDGNLYLNVNINMTADTIEKIVSILLKASQETN